MPEPLITVVIPTMGKRPRRLAAALSSLAAQDLPDERLEVVIGCDPGTTVPPAPPSLSVRVVAADAQVSAAAKRNLAWPQARARLVAFTDDDCRAHPGWAAKLVSVASAWPDAFLQGRTEPDPNEKRHLWGFAHTQWIARDSPWHETCNIAYPKDLLVRLGGFDEGYGPLGGEDTDLGARALEIGTAKVYAESAIVWHGVERRSFREAIREAFRPRDQPQVLARFPHLRRELTCRVFYRRGHLLLLFALAGILTRRRVLATLAAIPYVEWHLRHHRPTARSVARAATHLPVRVVVDAVEICVVAGRGLRRGVIAL